MLGSASAALQCKTQCRWRWRGVRAEAVQHRGAVRPRRDRRLQQGRLTPIVAPRIAGSAPDYLFTDRLKLPMVAAGLGYGAGAHAPNEIMLVEPKAGSKVAALPQQEKFYVGLLYALAESK
ncbi:MAG: hypothetical protein ABI647_13950 [Gemmatimonadota bacterium]